MVIVRLIWSLSFPFHARFLGQCFPNSFPQKILTESTRKSRINKYKFRNTANYSRQIWLVYCSSCLQINFLDNNVALIELCYPQCTFFWPLNVFIGSGSSEYEKLFKRMLDIWNIILDVSPRNKGRKECFPSCIIRYNYVIEWHLPYQVAVSRLMRECANFEHENKWKGTVLGCFKFSVVWLRWITKTLVSVNGPLAENRNLYVNRSASNPTVKFKFKGTGINLPWATVW
jgi:hypothetical protein